MCLQIVPELPADADIVIRALPGAAAASSEELLRQLRGAVRKLGVGPTGAAAVGSAGPA